MTTLQTLAIIPARGGSQRIPRKNIKPFLGKPIILYSIEAAKEAKIFLEIMVSTDDAEIADIAKKCGATVPFMRSPETADDHASLASVVKEALTRYAKRGIEFDAFCCILATAPLIRKEQLRNTFRVLEETQVSGIVPVVQFDFPPQRAFRITNDKLSMIWPEHRLTRSQDLEPHFHDAGMFYWCRTDTFQKVPTLYPQGALPLLLQAHEAQDIDTLDDWSLAELKYRLIHGSETE